MRDGDESGFPGTAERLRELARRVAPFPGIEPDANDPVPPGHGRGEGVERRFLVEVAQKAEDQVRGDAQVAPRVRPGRRDAFDHRLERHAAVGVCLRVEEDLRVTDVLGVGAREVGRGEVPEILRFDEHARRGVVDIEEVL